MNIYNIRPTAPRYALDLPARRAYHEQTVKLCDAEGKATTKVIQLHLAQDTFAREMSSAAGFHLRILHTPSSAPLRFAVDKKSLTIGTIRNFDIRIGPNRAILPDVAIRILFDINNNAHLANLSPTLPILVNGQELAAKDLEKNMACSVRLALDQTIALPLGYIRDTYSFLVFDVQNNIS